MRPKSQRTRIAQYLSLRWAIPAIGLFSGCSNPVQPPTAPPSQALIEQATSPAAAGLEQVESEVVVDNPPYDVLIHDIEKISWKDVAGGLYQVTSIPGGIRVQNPRGQTADTQDLDLSGHIGHAVHRLQLGDWSIWQIALANGGSGDWPNSYLFAIEKKDRNIALVVATGRALIAYKSDASHLSLRFMQETGDVDLGATYEEELRDIREYGYGNYSAQICSSRGRILSQTNPNG